MSKRRCACVEGMPLSLCERHLQVQVRNLLRQFGWTVTVQWSSINSPKGWPDCFAVRPAPDCGPHCWDTDPDPHPTEAVAIELKSEKGKVSPEQEVWLNLLGRLPGVKFAGVIRPSQWFAGALDEVLR